MYISVGMFSITLYWETQGGSEMSSWTKTDLKKLVPLTSVTCSATVRLSYLLSRLSYNLIKKFLSEVVLSRFFICFSWFSIGLLDRVNCMFTFCNVRIYVVF